MKRPIHSVAVLFALLGLVAAACGSGNSHRSAATTAAPATTDAPATAAAPATTAAPVQGSITVFAAASLTQAFNQVGAAFTRANPAAKVTFSFDASSALVQQITNGAPADVFASADTTNMDKLTKAGLNGTPPVLFATNLLGIIVPPGNPKGITGVHDLTKPGLKVVLCAVQVPCGQYAKQILEMAGMSITPVSYEQNVKGVVTKVTAGEADAGIVYVTDIAAAGSKASGVNIPNNMNVVADYPIASVKSFNNQAVDQAFIHFLLGPDGQAIMAKYGFLKP
jgi:molybdate transport system substrate-binding protein